MWSLDPTPGVSGKELTAEEKKGLGLSPKRMAFRQGRFVTKQARAVGIQPDDIILGIDDRHLEMNAAQFNAWIRLNYRVGDKITFNLLRNGERLNLPMTLAARDSF
jgi:S1-C subfamily serine protease